MANPILPHNPESTQDSKSLEWQTIDTSTPEGLRALDVLIARLLGWHIDADITEHGEIFYCLFTPDNTPIEDTMIRKSECIGETNAEKQHDAAMTIWEHFADDVDPIEDAPLPHYSTDANAALGLIDSLTYQIHHVSERGYIVDLAIRFAVFSEHASTLPLAICLAYLRYTDAAAAGNGGDGE